MTPIQVLISLPDGTFTIRSVTMTLDMSQALVGGYIEAVSDPAGNRFTAYVNEEGKIQNLALNSVSTRLLDKVWLDCSGRAFSSVDVLVGPVIWTGGPDGKGDDTSIDTWLAREFTEVALADPRIQGHLTTATSVIRSEVDGVKDLWILTGEDAQVADKVTDLSSNKAVTVEVWPSVTPAGRDALVDGFTRENGSTRIHL